MNEEQHTAISLTKKNSALVKLFHRYFIVCLSERKVHMCVQSLPFHYAESTREVPVPVRAYRCVFTRAFTARPRVWFLSAR